jgi:hypothetical protein
MALTGRVITVLWALYPFRIARELWLKRQGIDNVTRRKSRLSMVFDNRLLLFLSPS